MKLEKLCKPFSLSPVVATSSCLEKSWHRESMWYFPQWSFQSITLQLKGCSEPLVVCLFHNPSKTSTARLSNPPLNFWNFGVLVALCLHFLLEPFITSSNMPTVWNPLFTAKDQRKALVSSRQIEFQIFSSASSQDTVIAFVICWEMRHLPRKCWLVWRQCLQTNPFLMVDMHYDLRQQWDRTEEH